MHDLREERTHSRDRIQEVLMKIGRSLGSGRLESGPEAHA
jgi:hypothetical protein